MERRLNPNIPWICSQIDVEEKGQYLFPHQSDTNDGSSRKRGNKSVYKDEYGQSTSVSPGEACTLTDGPFLRQRRNFSWTWSLLCFISDATSAPVEEPQRRSSRKSCHTYVILHMSPNDCRMGPTPVGPFTPRRRQTLAEERIRATS